MYDLTNDAYPQWKEITSRMHLWFLVIGKLLHSVRTVMKNTNLYDSSQITPLITQIKLLSNKYSKYQCDENYLSKIVTINSNISTIIRRHKNQIEPKPVSPHLFVFMVSQVVDLLVRDLSTAAYTAFYYVNDFHILYRKTLSLRKNVSTTVDAIEQIYCNSINCSWDDNDINRTIRRIIDDCFFDILKELNTAIRPIFDSHIRSTYAKSYTKEQIIQLLSKYITSNWTLTGPAPAP